MEGLGLKHRNSEKHEPMSSNTAPLRKATVSCTYDTCGNEQMHFWVNQFAEPNFPHISYRVGVHGCI